MKEWNITLNSVKVKMGDKVMESFFGFLGGFL